MDTRNETLRRLYRHPSNSLKAGFTIVELIIVIVVIAILASIVLVSYSTMTQESKKTSLQSDLQQSEAELERARISGNK